MNKGQFNKLVCFTIANVKLHNYSAVVKVCVWKLSFYLLSLI